MKQFSVRSEMTASNLKTPSKDWRRHCHCETLEMSQCLAVAAQLSRLRTYPRCFWEQRCLREASELALALVATSYGSGQPRTRRCERLHAWWRPSVVLSPGMQVAAGKAAPDQQLHHPDLDLNAHSSSVKTIDELTSVLLLHFPPLSIV